LTDRKRKRYTKEFKKEAVELVTNQGYTIAEAARSLGIPRGMLGQWRRNLVKDQQNAFPGSGHQSTELEELKRLREENRKLRLEKEILKKAAAYFAKESG
jgi:transposase